MKKFINRHSELTFLESEYAQNGPSLVILYGRRRIGKTALMVEFGKDKEMLYFLATEESEEENRTAFKGLIADYTKNEILKESSISKWDLIFKELIKVKPEKRKLLVIDEFQYLGKTNQAFPSIFQKIWDTLLLDQNIMVVLCGSLITLMEEQTLNYSSPLYGRRTGQIRLKQIPFIHYHEFYPEVFQRKELIAYYSVTGGVPKYIELFNRSAQVDLYDKIASNILTTESYLYEEPIFLLQNEVKEIGSYLTLLKIISAGHHKLGHIASAAKLQSSQITFYLKTLINLDILKREVPITEKNPEKSKRGLYKIKDNYIAFWFQFVYPYTSYLETGQQEFVVSKIKQNLVDGHTAYVYEDVCLEEIQEMNKNHSWPFVFDKAGRWWNNSEEIDLVAFESAGTNIIFGECKYTEKPMDVDVFYKLLEKKQAVKWNNQNRREWFVLFSINGFTDGLKALANEREDLMLSF